MGIGDWVSGIFGSKNEEKAKAYEVDPNAYEYGGKQGGAQAEADRLRGRSDEMSAGMGEATRDAGAMYRQGYEDRTNAQQARGMQQDAANMARNRATGAVPSIAQMQADRQMGQAAAAQASAAASARGPAALALAQQNAAGNTATAQGNIAGQAQIAAAQERLAAEQAYAQQSGAMRGQDYQGQGLSFQGAGQQQQFALGLGNQALGWSQQQQGVNQAQLQAQQNKEAQRSANAMGAAGINAGVGGQNAAMDQKNAEGLVGMVSSAAGTIASDTRAKMSPGDVVASTWGNARPSGEQVQAASGALDTASQKSPTPIFVDPSAEDRQNAAGGGYMLGKQVGTAVYGGRPDGSLPSSVAAGMKSTGAAPKAENAKDEKKAGEAAKANEKQKGKLASVLDQASERSAKSAAGVDTSYHAGGGYVPPQYLSDENAKEPAGFGGFGGGGGQGKVSQMLFGAGDPLGKEMAAADHASGGGYVVKDGGMDVSGTMQKINRDVLRSQMQAGNGGFTPDMMPSDMLGKMPSDMTGKSGTMPSDMLGKTSSDERAKNPSGALGLDDPGLRIGDDGRGYIAQNAAPEMDAGQRHAAASKGKSSPGDMVASTFKPKGTAHRKQTDDDLMRQAMAMMGGIQSEKRAQLANGPAVRPDGSMMVSDNKAKAAAWDEGYAAATGDVKKMASMDADALKTAAEHRPIASAFRDAKASAWDEGRTANAARALASEPYVYKPGMTPPEQAPGEVNVGPMAQNMAKDPVAGTAVIKQPNGMLAIDIPKYTKVLGAVAAGQQEQIDEQNQKLSRLAQMMGGRR